jgi:hypothetical protein
VSLVIERIINGALLDQTFNGSLIFGLFYFDILHYRQINFNINFITQDYLVGEIIKDKQKFMEKQISLNIKP